MFSNIRPIFLVYGAIAAFSIALSVTIYFPNPDFLFQLDDAYIVIDNAQTLLSGGVDDSYQQIALVGSTSAVHLLLVSALGRAFEMDFAAYITVSAFTLLYALGLGRLLFQISQSIWMTLAGVIAGLFLGSGLYQLYGGLETGLAMAAVVWCLSLTESRSPIALPILCGVMPFIRPELAALSLSTLAWRWYNADFSIKFLIRDLALFGVGFLPWIAWFYFATGHISSQTGSAKLAFFADASHPSNIRLVYFLSAFLTSTLLPILLGMVFLGRRSFALPVLFFTCAFLGAYFIYLPSGLAHNHSRYLYILMPIGIIGYVSLVSRFSGFMRLPLFVVIFGALAFMSPPNFYTHEVGTPDVTRDGYKTAKWAQENLPPDARVLIHDAGVFAWLTSFETTDVVGLKSPESIASHEKYTLPTAGANRGAAVSEIASQNDITHAVILNDFFWNDLAGNLSQDGWNLEPIRTPEDIGYVIYEISK